MTRVLVTGGTGVLGSRVAARLAARGDDVRVLSRRSIGDERERVCFVQGELRAARGLREAIAVIDVIVHCATSPLWRAKATEVKGLENPHRRDGGRPASSHLQLDRRVDRIPFYYLRSLS